jgi:hypothetical protein
MINTLAYFALGLLAFTQLHSAAAVSTVFILACLYAIWEGRYNINITSLLFILLVGKIVELCVWQYIVDSNNYVIHSFYVVLDIIVGLLVGFRPALCRQVELQRTGQCEVKRYLVTNADMWVGTLYSFYVLFNILMLVEHSLRHLEDFGLAHSPWLYDNARWLWSNHAFIKLPLNMLEFIIILSTVKRYMQSARVIHA